MIHTKLSIVYFAESNVVSLNLLQQLATRMIKNLLSLSFSLYCVSGLSQSFTSSTLPIVEINTAQQIPNDGKVKATMQITFNGKGTTTSITDTPNIWNGEVEIGFRGASSTGYPQKSYSFTTMNAAIDSNIVILDMPREHDWVLINNWNEKSFARNTLAQKIFSEMGHYGVRLRHCEVVLNGTYNGIYLLGEKIKVDKGRVAISKLKDVDNDGANVSGGYIIKNDIYDGSNGWQSKYSPVGHSDRPYFIYEYPSVSKITIQQNTYIKSFLDSLEKALYSSSFTNTSVGYQKYISETSFIDYFLLNELFRNVDGFKKSSYWHKDRWDKGGKLRAGPVWDFDWSMKNIYDCNEFSNTDGSGWSYKIVDCPADVLSFGWYKRLLQSADHANKIHCRWEQLRSSILDLPTLFKYIDSVELALQIPQQRHFITFPVLGTNNGAPEVDKIPSTYEGEILKLKNWIETRINWLDQNMVGECSTVTAIDKPNTENVIEIFPMPSQGHFTIKSNGRHEQFAIYDQTGRIIQAGQLTGERTEFEWKGSKGIYLIRIGTSTYKIIMY